MPENNPLSGTRGAAAGSVREAMTRKKVSGRVLADRIGMPQSAFSRRMTGEVAFRFDELVAIADALDEPLAALLSGFPQAGVA